MGPGVRARGSLGTPSSLRSALAQANVLARHRRAAGYVVCVLRAPSARRKSPST